MKDPQETKVECAEERMLLKMLAIEEQMTKDLMLTTRCREPNEETQKVLKETDNDMNLLEHDALEDFWQALGFNRHA